MVVNQLAGSFGSHDHRDLGRQPGDCGTPNLVAAGVIMKSGQLAMSNPAETAAEFDAARSASNGSAGISTEDGFGPTPC